MGLARHPRRARPSDLACLSRLERAAARARRGAACGGPFGRAAACALDADLHGQRRALRDAVLSALSARRAVRQADGGQRLGHVDRELHDRAPRSERARARGGAGRGGSSPMAASACSSPSLCWRRWRRRCFAPPPFRSRLMPARDRARHLHLHHVGAARHARDPERDPDAVLRHDAVRRAGPRHHRLGDHARLRPVVALARGSESARGRRRLRRRIAPAARRRGRGRRSRWCASERRRQARSIPRRSAHGRPSDAGPPIALAALPLVVVVAVNLIMSLFVLPRMDASFLAEPAWGSTSLAARRWGVGGCHGARRRDRRRSSRSIFAACPALRDSMDAGANASVLPVLSVASLVGFGAVVAALPAFALVREWVLGIDGGPLVSLAVATNVLASLDRLGVGRPHHRARRAGQHLYADRGRQGHRSRRSCTASR